MICSNRKAFSLLELIVTIVIVITVVSVTYVSFFGAEKAGLVSAAQTELSQVSTDVSLFRSSHGYYPSSSAEYKELIPQFEWTTGSALNPKQISVTTAVVGSEVVLAMATKVGDLCVTATLPPVSSDIAPIRDVFEIGVGVDDDNHPRGTCTASSALLRPADSINSW